MTTEISVMYGSEKVKNSSSCDYSTNLYAIQIHKDIENN